MQCNPMAGTVIDLHPGMSVPVSGIYRFIISPKKIKTGSDHQNDPLIDNVCKKPLKGFEADGYIKA